MRQEVGEADAQRGRNNGVSLAALRSPPEWAFRPVHHFRILQLQHPTDPLWSLRMPSSPETRFQELHLTLPPVPKPVAKYKTAVRAGHILYVSGHGPLKDDKSLIVGKVGKDLNLEQGKAAARQVGLAVLSTLRDTLGSFDKVKRLIKTLGLVNCTDDFKDQPQVINGFSELMAEIFGEDAGVGARSAIGTNALPGNIAVEIECIFEVAD